MGPEHYYENLGGVHGMTSQLVGSLNQVVQPNYIQTDEPDVGPDNTIPQQAPRARGRRARQRTRPSANYDGGEEAEEPQQFPGPYHGEGTSTFGGATPYHGEGTSTF